MEPHLSEGSHCRGSLAPAVNCLMEGKILESTQVSVNLLGRGVKALALSLSGSGGYPLGTH